MVKIRGLNGYTYNKEKIEDFSLVITPPNDVIDSEERDEYYHKSKYNFVKLIKPESYSKSEELFESWVDEKILIKDEEETIYIYEASYTAADVNYKRTGFICLLKMEELGEGVLPHEKILEKDLKDRIELIETTKADFGVPFLLYDDKEKITDELIKEQVEKGEPYFSFTDIDDVTHTLFKVTDENFKKELQKEMFKHQCVIADGHHRYTSELRVGQGYGLMYFANSFNEGTVILPTNRVIFGRDIDMGEVVEELKKYFEIEEIDDINRLADKVDQTEILIDKENNVKNHVFGIYSNVDDVGYVLKLKDISVMDEFISDKDEVYKRIDINILHKIIIENILGISEEEQTNRQGIDFVKGKRETISKMEDKNNQLALFVNPPLIREVFLTSRSGETMPQKSTYFYPKVYSGLVSYKFD